MMSMQPGFGQASDNIVQQDIQFQVSIPAAGPGLLTEWGQLSSPRSTQGRTLLILISGYTYDHNYWDLPNVGSQYSFVKAANRAGFATLNLDRIGLGNSSKPPADTVTNQSQASTIHQIISQIRTGRFSHFGFSRVILVAHSGGSVIAGVEAGIFHDVDALVLTGFAHAFGPLLSEIQQVPASSDPRLAALSLPPGYLTNQPNVRGKFYYSAEDADPAVIAEDESLRTTVTTGELGDAGAASALMMAVTVPVLTVLGAQDRIFTVPGALPQAETEYQFFGNADSHQTIVIPRSGHSVQLALSAEYTDTLILRWISRIVTFGPWGGHLVQGGADDDILAGDAKGKVIFGGTGDDTIIVNGGNNLLTGGAGADRFIIRGGSGSNLITDFNGEAGDRLVIDPLLTYTVVPLGQDTIIRLSNGVTIALTGVSVKNFQTSWVETN